MKEERKIIFKIKCLVCLALSGPRENIKNCQLVTPWTMQLTSGICLYVKTGLYINRLMFLI
jgi:hypothetical protein